MQSTKAFLTLVLAGLAITQSASTAEPEKNGPNARIEKFEREKKLLEDAERKQNSVTDACLVTDPDLRGKYTGQCVQGRADGSGTAVGLDTYVGEFKAGMKDGQGVYSWADGARFEGEYRKDSKVVGTLHFPPGHPGRKAREYLGKGHLEGDDYVLVGRFTDGFVPCPSLAQCR